MYVENNQSFYVTPITQPAGGDLYFSDLLIQTSNIFQLLGSEKKTIATGLGTKPIIFLLSELKAMGF